MPDVIIKGMEMPPNCKECRLHADGWCYAVEEQPLATLGICRPDWCPLRPAPKEYIDGNNLFSRIAGHSYYYGDTILAAIQCAIEGKESHESIPPTDISPAPEWISVEDRLPEETGEYLVWILWPCDEYPTRSIVNYDADAEAFGEWEEYYDRQTLGWSGSEFKRIEKVYAWMPLPEPPKEE